MHSGHLHITYLRYPVYWISYPNFKIDRIVNTAISFSQIPVESLHDFSSWIRCKAAINSNPAVNLSVTDLRIMNWYILLCKWQFKVSYDSFWTDLLRILDAIDHKCYDCVQVAVAPSSFITLSAAVVQAIVTHKGSGSKEYNLRSFISSFTNVVLPLKLLPPNLFWRFIFVFDCRRTHASVQLLLT